MPWCRHQRVHGTRQRYAHAGAMLGTSTPTSCCIEKWKEVLDPPPVLQNSSTNEA